MKINEIKIPSIIRFIVCDVYYNKNKLKRVYDKKNDQKKMK